jgi:hypothetical protein
VILAFWKLWKSNKSPGGLYLISYYTFAYLYSLIPPKEVLSPPILDYSLAYNILLNYFSISAPIFSIMNTPLILSGQSWCVIYCLKARFSEYLKDWQCSLVRPLVKSIGGDYHSASVLGIIKGEKVFVVFNYNNLEYFSTYKVLGFHIKQTLVFKCITIPINYIHLTVNRWLEENKC